MSRTPLIASLVTGLALLTACSQAATPGAPAASSASVPASSTPAASTSATAGNAVDDFLARMSEGQSEVKTYKVTMKSKTEANGTEVNVTMKGVVDQTDSSGIKMSATMTFAGMEMKLIKIDGAMYIQMTATGPKWMKVPASQMAQYESSTKVDYAGMFAKAKDSIESVELVGQDTVGGVATTHYKVTLDAAALAEMNGTTSEDVTVTTDTFAYDVWLDDSNRPRKISMSMTAKVNGKKVPMSVLVTMSNYNEPVTIKAPAKSQIQG